ncbi:MAG: NosD domain-containing protein [Halobacteriota archaeon]|nr:NosD domain-containing protein [Halobacteriota archaeon]
MTINYCDYTGGDDTTGDGSAGNPYKTITKASTGLTGGDEVRVAKSPTHTNLTGTLGFTVNSTAVVGTGTSFTTELAVGDFVLGGDSNWWEVVTITDNTNATLYKKYSGDTESGVSSQKLGVTSTGEAAASDTVVQEVSTSGTSGNNLKISGGWDLSGPTQDGQTYFRQMHTTFANRYGYGLYATGKSYVEIERLHFLRYNYGIHLSSSSNNTITSPTCNSNNDYGIYTYISFNNTITSPTCNSNSYGILFYFSSNNTITSTTCNSNSYYGIYIHTSSNNTITSPTCNSNNDYGIYTYISFNNTITSPTCNSNNDYGIRLSSSSNNTITSPTCSSNNSYGIYIHTSSNNIINNYSGTGNGSGDVYVYPGIHYGDYPCAKCQHFKTAGVNKCFFEYGTTERDTANARGGSGECLEYTPTSATYYINQSFFFIADSGVAQTLSAYLEKDSSFNGDVQGAIYFMGVKITGWTAITPSVADTYEQKSLVAAEGDITEDGVLELRIKVRGTAGNIYVDDLSTA